jgi:hypothetical protein
MVTTTFRIMTVAILGLALALAAPGAATADQRTVEREVRTVGPIVFDAPAGTRCDFAYHEEGAFTQHLERFYAGNGDLIAVHDQVTISVLHRNADTGRTLIETDRYSAHVDFVTGEATNSGQGWHLVDEDGRLVLSGAGHYTIDLATGDVRDETPNAGSDFPSVICPALGGAPAG